MGITEIEKEIIFLKIDEEITDLVRRLGIYFINQTSPKTASKAETILIGLLSDHRKKVRATTYAILKTNIEYLSDTRSRALLLLYEDSADAFELEYARNLME